MVKTEYKNVLETIWDKVRFDQQREWDKIAFSFLNRCERIIDVGCGEGRFISQGKDNIVGVDWNEASLNKCKSLGYNVKKGDVRQLPFEDSSVQGIHCSHVIEHFSSSDVYKILSECDRVLMPQGILVIRSPLLWWGFYSDLTHVRPYNPEVIIRYFTPWTQHTLQQISTNYKVVYLKWRYDQVRTKIKLCNGVFNLLNRWGFPWLKKTGYMLMIQKK